MASNLLTHHPLASTHKASIAFFLLIITIFVIPFFSLSATFDLIPSPRTLTSIASALWVSLLDILTSSPFYFFLLNFLIVALVFLSGVLDPSLADRESDGLQQGDLHQRGFHSFSTAAQIIHERLSFDELYELQASSSPYLDISESSHTYVADDRMIGDGCSDEDKARIGEGNQVMANQIKSAGGSDSQKAQSSSNRVHATEEFYRTISGMIRADLDEEIISPVSSVVVKSELGHPLVEYRDVHAENTQVSESRHLYLESNAHADANVEVNADADADVDANANANADVHVDAHTVAQTGNVINTETGVLQDEVNSNVIHDEGKDGHIDAENAHNDQECNGIREEAEASKKLLQQITQIPSDTEGDTMRRQRIAQTSSESVKQQHRPIARTPSETAIAGSIYPQQKESNVRADMGRCMSLERGEWLGVEKQKAGMEEKEMMSLSREELNERASAFISAFRKKLVSTAIDVEAHSPPIHTTRSKSSLL